MKKGLIEEQKKLLEEIKNVPKCPVHGDDPEVDACSCMIVATLKKSEFFNAR